MRVRTMRTSQVRTRAAKHALPPLETPLEKTYVGLGTCGLERGSVAAGAENPVKVTVKVSWGVRERVWGDPLRPQL